jgi:hypothetical protein
VIFGRCAPTFRSLGFAYGSIEILALPVCDKKNWKRGKRFSEGGFVVEEMKTQSGFAIENRTT